MATAEGIEMSSIEIAINDYAESRELEETPMLRNNGHNIKPKRISVNSTMTNSSEYNKPLDIQNVSPVYNNGKTLDINSVSPVLRYPAIDGSWELRILVTDLQVERVIRVKGDLHIGGVMLKLVDELDIPMDWSDHAMWWPWKNQWLNKTRWTLDQYSITADAVLHFTPMHKMLRVQLPDLRYVDCNVDYSAKTFSAVLTLCTDLGIRHPEELSLCKPVDEEHLKINYGDFRRIEEKKRRVTLGATANHTMLPYEGSPRTLKSQRNGGSGGHGLYSSHGGSNYFNSTNDVYSSGNIELRPDTNTFIPSSRTGTLQHPNKQNGHSEKNGTFRKISTLSLGGGHNGSLKFMSLSRNSESAMQRKSEHTSPLFNNGHSNGNGNGGLPHYATLNGHHSNGHHHRNGGMNNGHSSLTLNGYHHHNPNGNMSFPSGTLNSNGRTSSEWSLAFSPPPSDEAKYSLVRPKNLAERARLNVAWLDSSLSLMEQGVRDFDTLLLRFKFHCFYDLNAKSDPVRINLIYEQAKWQLLNEGIDCTEEEMMLFAALQLQVALQANVPQPNNDDDADDDVDAALTDLQISLEGNGAHFNGVDIVSVPFLSDYLSYLRPKRFTLKGYKKQYFVLRDLQLSSFRSQEESTDYGIPPVFTMNLKGCEVTPEVNISSKKYGIRLAVPSAEGMTELWLKCESESQYARWMAACRLASKGKSMADPSYDTEVKSIQAFLSMQHPASLPVINPATLDINVEEYVAARFLRKSKSKLRQKILEGHANVKDLNLVEAKMNFIKAWQSLPDYGVSLFVVRFHGEKRNELLGIAFNRLMRMNIQTGDHVKTWRYNTIKAWNVNWETKHMMIQLGDNKKVIFKTLSADCKVVHEFIGGYIFLSMRSKDSNQQLDEELFHKLTGGWH